jgi:hypothetical protein
MFKTFSSKFENIKISFIKLSYFGINIHFLVKNGETLFLFIYLFICSTGL